MCFRCDIIILIKMGECLMKVFFLIIVGILFFTGNIFSQIDVVVGILPAQFLADQIGGNYVKTTCLIQPGVEAHSFSVSPQDMFILSRAKLYLAYGFPFENNLVKKLSTLNPALKVVFLHKGLYRNFENTSHPDPHIWLSPKRFLYQAHTVLEALEELLPAHRNDLRENYKKLSQKIIATDLKINGMFDKLHQKEFLVYHPAWSYFSEDYGLKMISIQEEGKDPTPQRLLQLFSKVKRDKIKIIFVQNTFHSPTVSAFVANAHLKKVIIKDIFYDWPLEIVKMAQTIKRGLE
jgi:zinc transport system substrate-binding protein